MSFFPNVKNGKQIDPVMGSKVVLCNHDCLSAIMPGVSQQYLCVRRGLKIAYPTGIRTFYVRESLSPPKPDSILSIVRPGFWFPKLGQPIPWLTPHFPGQHSRHSSPRIWVPKTVAVDFLACY